MIFTSQLGTKPSYLAPILCSTQCAITHKGKVSESWGDKGTRMTIQGTGGKKTVNQRPNVKERLWTNTKVAQHNCVTKDKVTDNIKEKRNTHQTF